METYRDFDMEVDEPVRPDFKEFAESFAASHGEASVEPIIQPAVEE